MIATTKPMIVMAALIAAGLVTMMDMAQSLPQQPSAAATVAARFPGAAEIMVAHNVGKSAPVATPAPIVNASKSGKLAPASCVHEHWPYMADECLSSDQGSKPRRPVRTIAIERQVAANTVAAIH